MNTHSLTSTIVRLMASVSELIYILGRYLGIYAKDSLDELLLTTHHKSSYKGWRNRKSREIERNAVNHYINGLEKRERREWTIERSETREEDEMSKPNGDNFPYIRGHSNPY